jgi:hypothetical protein
VLAPQYGEFGEIRTYSFLKIVVLHLFGDRQGLLQVRLRFLQSPAIPSEIAQVAQCFPLLVLIAHLTEDRQTLLQVRLCLLLLSAIPRNETQEASHHPLASTILQILQDRQIASEEGLRLTMSPHRHQHVAID